MGWKRLKINALNTEKVIWPIKYCPCIYKFILGATYIYSISQKAKFYSNQYHILPLCYPHRIAAGSQTWKIISSFPFPVVRFFHSQGKKPGGNNWAETEFGFQLSATQVLELWTENIMRIPSFKTSNLYEPLLKSRSHSTHMGVLAHHKSWVVTAFLSLKVANVIYRDYSETRQIFKSLFIWWVGKASTSGKKGLIKLKRWVKRKGTHPKSVCFYAFHKANRWLRGDSQAHRSLPGIQWALAGNSKNPCSSLAHSKQTVCHNEKPNHNHPQKRKNTIGHTSGNPAAPSLLQKQPVLLFAFFLTGYSKLVGATVER